MQNRLMSLLTIEAIFDQRERTDRYKELCEELVSGGNEESLKSFVDHMVREEVPQVVSRGVLAHFAQTFGAHLRGDLKESIGMHTIQKIQPRVTSFEEADNVIRNVLFDYFLEEESFKQAAHVLSGINVESGARIFPDGEKADHYVKIAEAFLADEETVDAETYVNRASSYIHTVPDDWKLQLRYRVTHARVLDSNKKFLDASFRYHELSQTQNEDVVQNDLFELLGKSVTCAILGESGPRRTRMLAMLFKDDRCQQLENFSDYSTHHIVLTKMYKGQLIKRKEMAAFEHSLQPHQNATRADGLTIPEVAVIEHNILAASNLYNNIRFQELGALLDTDPEKAERVAARMISQDRLNGSIDQIEGVLEFNRDNDTLQLWDDQITSICGGVNACVEAVTKSFPQFVP